MGIEVIIGAVAAAASVVTGIQSLSAARAASRERKKANEIATAQQQNESADSRRKAVREARVRRAMILQQSENAGLGTQGSGTQGAIGVVGTNLGSRNAAASGQTAAITSINAANQRAADYDYKSAAWGSIGNIFSTALGQFGEGMRSKPSSNSFSWG